MKSVIHCRACVVSCWLAMCLMAKAAAESPIAGGDPSFNAVVAPALAAKCVACHRPDNLKGGFDMTTREGLLKGGDNGSSLVPGKSAESPLYTRAIAPQGQRPEMPEKGEPLTAKEADALRDWIGTGAPWPEKFVLKEKAKADANPLTRRVLVNRLWHHHFGQGLVNTPSDFGYGGDRASHPELLDWLANEVLRSDWSLKKLHKAIMLSATYRQSSAFVPGHAKVDGDNRLLWRQNTRRLDAESLRDAVLLVTGKPVLLL